MVVNELQICLSICIKLVVDFHLIPLWEDGFSTPFVFDVDTVALHEVATEFSAERLVVLALVHERVELWLQQSDQAVERLAVAGMRRSREKQHVTRGVLRQFAHKLVAVLQGCSAVGAGMGLVNHDEFRRGAQKVVTVRLGLDVVEADHDGVVIGEDRFISGDVTLQARNSATRERDSIEVEVALKLAGPLIDEVRRTEHGETGNLPAIKQFAHNKGGLNGLADTHVVGHQKPRDRHLERHEKRHELIGSRRDAKIAEGSERPRAASELHAEGVAQQFGLCGVAELCRVWRRKRS